MDVGHSVQVVKFRLPGYFCSHCMRYNSPVRPRNIVETCSHVAIALFSILQQHSNTEIYERCIKIMETYFGVEEEEEMAGIAPQMENDQFGFGMNQHQQPPGGFDFGGQ